MAAATAAIVDEFWDYWVDDDDDDDVVYVYVSPEAVMYCSLHTLSTRHILRVWRRLGFGQFLYNDLDNKS